MANFFTDNQDIQYYLNDLRLRRIIELREKGYTENKAYPFAPENFEDALDTDNNFTFTGTPGTYILTVDTVNMSITLN